MYIFEWPWGGKGSEDVFDEPALENFRRETRRDEDDGTISHEYRRFTWYRWRKLAIVVSAMGGKPKVTDMLLDCVTAASIRDKKEANNLLSIIRDKHVRSQGLNGGLKGGER